MAFVKRKHSLFFGITSRTLMTISAILLMLSYLSRYINPAEAWFMTMFGLMFTPLLICNIILLVWAICRKSKAMLIPLLALMPTIFMTGKFVRFTSGNQEDVSEGLKILTYNVGRFSLPQNGRYSSWRECADSVMAFLKEEDADIICLQEFYMNDAEKLRSYLSSKMKGYDIKYFVNINSHGCYGNVTLSRFPALTKGKIDFEHSANLAIYSEYNVGGTIFRVYNCHFQSYNISIPRLATSLERDYKKTMRDTEEKMKRSITRRPKQVEDVMRDIDSSPVEAIVVGDFNDTPMSYTYYRLCRARKDSFEEAGTGFGATFAHVLPFLRIDYILFPDKFNALRHRVIHRDYSDHYPVEAIIRL